MICRVSPLPLSAHVAVVDQNGTILAVTAAWQAFGKANVDDNDVGCNYLAVCAGASSEEHLGRGQN